MEEDHISEGYRALRDPETFHKSIPEIVVPTLDGLAKGLSEVWGNPVHVAIVVLPMAADGSAFLGASIVDTTHNQQARMLEGIFKQMADEQDRARKLARQGPQIIVPNGVRRK